MKCILVLLAVACVAMALPAPDDVKESVVAQVENRAPPPPAARQGRCCGLGYGLGVGLGYGMSGGYGGYGYPGMYGPYGGYGYGMPFYG